MKNIIFPIAFLLTFAGCGPAKLYKALPDDYIGEKATISDSISDASRTKAHFFVLHSVDGHYINNSVRSSIKTGYNSAGYILPTVVSRDIPVKSQKIKIWGSIQYGAPIFAMFGTEVFINHEFEFTPKPDSKYRVNGILNENYASIWIENYSGEKVITPFEKFKKGKKLSEQEKIKYRESALIMASINVNELPNDEYFLQISYGSDIKDIINKLGQADKITENSSNAFTGRQASTDYFYNGLGNIRAIGEEDAKIAYKINPELDVMKYDAEDILHHMQQPNKMVRHLFVLQYFKAGIEEQEMLDILAKQVWKNRYTKDDRTADSMAWICKLFGKSNGSRYLSFLKELEGDEKVHSQITKYASKTVTTIKKKYVEVIQFNP